MTPRPLRLVAEVQRLLAADEAEWIKTSARLAGDLVRIANPAERAARYADLTARLAALGEALLPADDARVRASFVADNADDDDDECQPACPQRGQEIIARKYAEERQAAEWRAKAAAERERRERENAKQAEECRKRRIEWEAQREAERQLEAERRWLSRIGVPLVAAAPPAMAALIFGWGPAAIFVAVLNLPWMLDWPVLVAVLCIGAIIGVASWVRHRDTSDVVLPGLVVAGLSVVSVLALRELPIYIVGPRVVAANGLPMTGMVVALSPGFGDQTMIDVLWGVAGAPRGSRFTTTGPSPERGLRGR